MSIGVPEEFNKIVYDPNITILYIGKEWNSPYNDEFHILCLDGDNRF